VEPARPRDALAILGIHRDVLQEGTWFATRPDELAVDLEGSEQRIKEAARSGRSVLLVARAPSRPVVGWLALNGGALQRTRHTARLEVMVARSDRGKGAGEALVRAGLLWAEDHPWIAKIGLAVYAHNERALGLYRKLGFEEEGRRIAEYRLEDGSWRDDVLMYRWVKPR
jgi:ribosomal protein S18 acetylase RimI-like enzyme